MNGRVAARVIAAIHHVCYSCLLLLVFLQQRIAAESLSAL
jgi:hypothetical protein